MTVEEIRAWPVNEYGWHVSPGGLHVRLGNYVRLGNDVTLGDDVWLGDGVTLGNGVRLGNYVWLGNGVRLGNYVRLGDGVRLGNYVWLGDGVTLGNGVRLGNDVTLGDDVWLGDGVTLGNGVWLGNYVWLGNDVRLGDGVRLGNGVTSEVLAAEFRAAYEPDTEYVFIKWVTPDRHAPGWGGAKRIAYPVGAVIKEPDAEFSDQQCAVGLHVLRPGYRPEYIGLPSGDYIPLKVAVFGRDICFAGLPGWDAKIRVRKLRVLE